MNHTIHIDHLFSLQLATDHSSLFLSLSLPPSTTASAAGHPCNHHPPPHTISLSIPNHHRRQQTPSTTAIVNTTIYQTHNSHLESEQQQPTVSAVELYADNLSSFS
ncbi:hypothetical protein Hanom_Chr03g00276201 [Helianthus anomalus]